MKKTLKALAWILLVLLVLVVLAVASLLLASGPLITNAVNAFGPKALGVPVTLQEARFAPFQGTVRLTKLHVGNPEGFRTPGLFDLGDVAVELDTRSLLRDMIVIRKIDIVAPEITYERSLRSSNISALMKHLQGDKTKPAEAPGSEPAQAGKKVVIDRLVIRDPKLHVTITAAGGHAVPIALGQIEIKDIGRDTGGVTVDDVIRIIFSVVTSNIENAVLGAGDLLGTGAKAVTGTITSVGEAVVGGAAQVGTAVVGTAAAVGGAAVKTVGAVGDAVLDGAGAVGGATVKGVGAVGGAVVGGAASAVKGIGSLVGIGSDEKKPEEPPVAPPAAP